MLAVVEYEQHRAVADGADERFGWPAAAVGDVERGRDFARDARRIRDRREVDPAGPRVSRRLQQRRLLARAESFRCRRRPVSVSSRVAPISRAELAQLVAATNEPRQVDG